MYPQRVGFFGLLCACLVGGAMVTPSRAVRTSFWEVRYQEQFDRGTPEDISIHSDGKVSLGPKFDLVADTEEAFVWCLAEDSRGNIYAGTGNNGKIFKISSGGQMTLWYDSEELEILSLAVDRHDYLYVGTSPGGQVVRISPKGEANIFFSTEEDHVWALAFAQDGHLFCGTGAEGKIFKVPQDGPPGCYTPPPPAERGPGEGLPSRRKLKTKNQSPAKGRRLSRSLWTKPWGWSWGLPRPSTRLMMLDRG
jgi:hypothetical protein